MIDDFTDFVGTIVPRYRDLGVLWVTFNEPVTLFVTMAEDVVLDEALRERIRHGASPRHGPDETVAAPGIPHTRTGKKPEVPVKRLPRGDDPATVADPGGIDQPGLLGWYHEFGVAHRDY